MEIQLTSDRGGYREGSGRRKKWEGHETKNKRVPRGVPDRLVDRWIDILLDLQEKGYKVEEMTVSEVCEIFLRG